MEVDFTMYTLETTSYVHVTSALRPLQPIAKPCEAVSSARPKLSEAAKARLRARFNKDAWNATDTGKFAIDPETGV